jgi:S1-C subfamily serine protease
VNGHAVNTPTDLTNLLLALHPGDSAQVGYTDSSGSQHTATVTLGDGPPQ